MALTIIDIILGIILIGLLIAIAIVYRRKEKEYFNETIKKKTELNESESK